MHPQESTATSPKMGRQEPGFLRGHVGRTQVRQSRRNPRKTFLNPRHSTGRSQIHQTTRIPNRTSSMSAKDELSTGLDIHSSNPALGLNSARGGVCTIAVAPPVAVWRDPQAVQRRLFQNDARRATCGRPVWPLLRGLRRDLSSSRSTLDFRPRRCVPDV